MDLALKEKVALVTGAGDQGDLFLKREIHGRNAFEG